jgi:hypothetical protein
MARYESKLAGWSVRETPLFWCPLTCAGIGRNSPQVAASVVVQAELVHNARQHPNADPVVRARR